MEDRVDGLLVPPRDPDAIGRAVLELRDNPALRESIVREALEKARSRSIEKVTAEMMERLSDIFPPSERGGAGSATEERCIAC